MIWSFQTRKIQANGTNKHSKTPKEPPGVFRTSPSSLGTLYSNDATFLNKRHRHGCVAVVCFRTSICQSNLFQATRDESKEHSGVLWLCWSVARAVSLRFPLFGNFISPFLKIIILFCCYNLFSELLVRARYMIYLRWLSRVSPSACQISLFYLLSAKRSWHSQKGP